MNDKRTMTAITAALLCLSMAGCAAASAQQEAERPTVGFRYVCDWGKSPEPQGAARIVAEAQQREAEKAAQEQRDAQEAAEAAQPEWEAAQEYYEPSQGVTSVQGNPDGLNSFDGVYEYGDHVETYYSTRAVYDDQLVVDEQGFYRTEEGYYVVASSEHAEGEHVQISQGEAVVMDSGPEAGVIDVHTAW